MRSVSSLIIYLLAFSLAMSTLTCNSGKTYMKFTKKVLVLPQKSLGRFILVQQRYIPVPLLLTINYVLLKLVLILQLMINILLKSRIVMVILGLMVLGFKLKVFMVILLLRII